MLRQKLTQVLPQKLLKEAAIHFYCLFDESREISPSLKSDSHVYGNFCQIKIFPNLVRKNTVICLFGV